MQPVEGPGGIEFGILELKKSEIVLGKKIVRKTDVRLKKTETIVWSSVMSRFRLDV